MKKITILSMLCAVTFGAFSQNVFKKETTTTNNNKKSNLENGMYAKINTTKGDILIQLEYEKTPLTVANFVALAEGTMENNKKNQGVPYYNGLKFHRVIADFMIQGGCPEGTGGGGPGYNFYDETRKDLTHNGPGILSMANSDPQGSKQAYGSYQQAWSENGQIGYVYFFGVDALALPNTAMNSYQPYVFKTINGGSTWARHAALFNFTTIPSVNSRLYTVHSTTLAKPFIAPGEGASGTVDAAGNLHLFASMNSSWEPRGNP